VPLILITYPLGIASQYLSQGAGGWELRRAPPVHPSGGQPMPIYKIAFIGGSNLVNEPMIVHCVDDAQAMNWASHHRHG
jgi:hypothetical protein